MRKGVRRGTQEALFWQLRKSTILAGPRVYYAGVPAMRGPSSYIFAGGGSGGHLFPGIAVVEDLLDRDPDARITFLGTDRPVEHRILATHGYEHIALSAQPLGSLLRSPFAGWRFLKACRTARIVLEQERPRGVVGLGGYASAPAIIAASSLGIPTLLLEQNAVAGRATCWLSGRASLVCLSFAETRGRFSSRAKLCVTGNPVRRAIANLAEVPARISNDLINAAEPTLLILGGSQGATAVNEITLQTVGGLRSETPGLRIVHQTGEQHCQSVRATYAELGVRAQVEPFFPGIVELYQQADLVISRAGATTLAELACAGCPAVLIPYPGSAADHQLCNARVFESAGAACIVEQDRTLAHSAELLSRTVQELRSDPARLIQMRRQMKALARPAAASDVVDRLEQLIAGESAYPAAVTEDESVGRRQ
jgi:UDP-N-acetylglucosamine--N-acetylmuramyl-(pentapeptide) pyrophosphoryl-undecaprenol N-acetylglucosamine transferase